MQPQFYTIWQNLSYYFSQFVQILMFLAGLYYFGIEIFGWRRKKEPPASLTPPQKRFACIVAAHNEEKVIGHIVDSLANQNYPRELYSIYVIADNCDDQTAKIAAEHGAEVHIRKNAVERGKGFALEWMFERIFKTGIPFDAVCVFDADNLVSPNFLLEMNRQLVNGHKVIQGYIDSKNPYDSWITLSYSIAFWMFNRIFQLARYQLNLSNSLCGTGFCIATDVLKKIGWGATCLTEDLEFTMKLALNDLKVSWAHDAVVYDEKPLTLKQSWNQRKRWMQGHADCAQRYLPALFRKAFTRHSFIAFDCAVYLFQPIRFIFLGLITIMMWVQTFYRELPLFYMEDMFNVIHPIVWDIYVIFGMLYGPLVVMAEKKFKPQVIWGFIIYPFYCLTWVPITIQGFLTRNNKTWCHTEHTREISLKDLEKSVKFGKAQGLDKA